MWNSCPMWHNVCSNVLTYLIYSNIVLFIYSFIKCVINIYCSSYFRASFNPLITNDYKWITLRNKSSISSIIYPVPTSLHCELPFMNINGADLINTIQTDINVDHNFGSELTDHQLDYSILGSIDPDTNYLSFTKQLDCQYYTENEFNKIPN